MIIKNFFKKTISNRSPVSSKDWKSISPFAVEIINKLQDHNYEAYLVGGCVRDLLANIKPKDFDIATNAEPKEIRKIFKASRIIGKRFQLVHIYKGKQIIEVATFRAGLDKNSTTIENDLIKDDAGKIIRDNIWGNIEDDCNRRDFTINAIYFCPISNTFKDFHDGAQHVKEKKIISIGDPLYRFEEDPVRSLRAIRFATKLNFKLDSKVKEAIYEKGDLLGNISNARLFDECCKIFLNGHGYENYKKLQSFGIAKYLLNLEKKYSGNKVYDESFKNTDKRYRDGKSITPGFLLAAILWPRLIERCSFDNGINVRKFFRSMDSIIAEQQRITIAEQINANKKLEMAERARLNNQIREIELANIEGARQFEIDQLATLLGVEGQRIAGVRQDIAGRRQMYGDIAGGVGNIVGSLIPMGS